MSLIRAVMSRYFAIHGPLLAKGLSFTALFAAIPLLFLLTLASSMVLTGEVLTLVEGQFLMGLPENYRQSVMLSLQGFAENPGSLTIVTIGVFLYSVHTLFFDVHRVVRAGLGIAVTPGRGRLRAVALNGFFLLLIYVTAIATTAAQFGAAYLGISDTLLEFVTRISAVLVMATTLGSIVRLSGGRTIPFRTMLPVFLTAGIAWQGATFLSSFFVRSAGRRMVVYGVLASAVLFLLLMRIFAEILLHSALWVHELEKRRRQRESIDSENDPSPEPEPESEPEPE